MSSGTRPPTCVPTWQGHIETTKDALIIFQACFDGALHHCSRRPHDRERNSLIVSGNVFVYEEQTSGIKRWTDGIPWSPSRILTNFLIYRQLNSPFPPGEKKRATKRNARSSKPGEGYSTPTSTSQTPTGDDPRSFGPSRSPESPLVRKDDESPDKDSNRGLVGSLVDSYEFKEGGLLKKTMTVSVRGISHHLVSYYCIEDAKHRLKTPREDSRFKDIVISESLLKQPKFKFPNFDDAGDGTFEQQDGGHAQYGGYYHAGAGYSHYPQYAYAASNPYGHQAAYASSHGHQQNAAYSMPPSNAMYAPTTQHYGQGHHPHYQYYQPQVQPQYHSSYPQQYHAHQAQLPQAQMQSAQSMAPIKQEPTPTTTTTTPNYGYSSPAQHHQAAQHPNLNQVYGTPQTNGTAAEEDHAAPSSTQAPQPQTWPAHTYTQQWASSAPRPDGQVYAQQYRPSG